MSDEQTCPKCGGGMEHGFVLDNTSGAGGAVSETWQDGAPQKSFWTGVKLLRDQQRPVVSYRCERCGYLESYAL